MYSFESRVRYSECDASCTLSTDALINYFQDASTFQSEELGAGFAYLMPRNLVWVLASWQIEIYRLPKLGEEIIIGTLPYDFKSFLGYRNFLMKTKAGEMLARANSLWTLLNFDTMKPAIPSKELLDKYTVEPRLEMEYSGRKIVVGDNGRQEEPVIVRKQHLDSNYHVNNGQYLSITGDYLPENFAVYRIRTEYKKQAHLHDVLIPYVVTEGKRVVVSLRDEKGAVYMNAEYTAAEDAAEMGKNDTFR